MLKAQGYVIGGGNRLTVPEGVTPNTGNSLGTDPSLPGLRQADDHESPL